MFYFSKCYHYCSVFCNCLIPFLLPGFVLGGAFGVFTAGIDTNVGFDPKDPLKTPTAREVLRDMGQRGMSYAKNFAIVGAMFSCTECIIESVSFLLDSTVSLPLQKFCFRCKIILFTFNLIYKKKKEKEI